MLALIRRAASDLPADVAAALRAARRRERPGSPARWALDTILENVRLARARGAPLCQDTGALQFYVRLPFGYDVRVLERAVPAAVRQATRRGWLRPNTLDAVTGASRPGNLGPGAPAVHLEFGRGRALEVRLLLKGGGSENVSAQYSLPDQRLAAGRDLEGVRRCVLDAVVRAQGRGCAPGVLGVCLGGDRAAGMAHAKRQLLRPLGARAADPRLAALERRLLREANTLGIGPMGFGGATTLLGVRCAALDRLPASYFVSVAYLCWAARRAGVRLDAGGSIREWIEP